MTTENELSTSVDEKMLSLAEQIVLLQDEQKDLAETQRAEREAQQVERFNEIVKIDLQKVPWDALEAIGVTGYTVSSAPDADGGPPVRSLKPVFQRTSKPRTNSGGGSTGSRRNLVGTFEEHATPEERAEFESIKASGGDNNKEYALRNKVFKRINP